MTKKRKTLIIATLATMAISCSVLSCSLVSLIGNAGDNATLVDASKFETDGVAWKYQEIVSRPTANFTFGGETKQADVKIVYPNGKESEGKGDLITLDTEGSYTVEYTASFGGTEFMETDTFVIKKDLFYVTGSGSSARYYNYVYKDHAKDEYSSAREEVVNSSVSGIYVSLASGDSFQYSRVIDVSKLTYKDNLFKFVIAPEQIGVRDVSGFTVTLTDAYDSTNYVTFAFNSNSDVPMVYCSVAASNGQKLTGWQYGNADISKCTKKVNTTYGAPMRFSLTGPCAMTEQQVTQGSNVFASQNDIKFGINSIADNDFGLSIDYATKKVMNRVSAHYATKDKYPSGLDSDIGLIADLDNPDDFDKLWGGFTTGECFLSVQGGAYLGETFNFMITEINGISGSLLNADADRQAEILSFNDRGSLSIEVDNGEYSFNDLPLAKVGTAYPIFDTKVKNQYYHDLKTTYEVYKDDALFVKNGEPFIPDAVGEYTIVYTVKDYFGTTKKSALKVYAVSETPTITFDLQGLDAIAETAQAETKGVAGKWVKLHDAVNLDGGSADGILAVASVVTKGDKSYEVQDGLFFPTEGGEYTVVVTVSDYIGQKLEKTYTVKVDAGEIPVYLEKPVLPKYFIAGRNYLLPSVNAYDYTDGSGKVVKTKVAYVDGEGIKKAIGTQIVPVATLLKKTVDVIYYTDDINAKNDYAGNLVFKDLPIVEVVSAENGNVAVDFAKLFVENGVTITKNLTSATLTSEDGGTIECINALGVNGFSLRFKGVAEESNFERFTITFADSQNPEESITFYYINGADKTTFTVNSLQGTQYNVAQSFRNGDMFILSYDVVSGVKCDRTSANFIKIEEYQNGKPFAGFTSGKIYVTIGIEETKDVSAVELLRLAEQAISQQTKDRVAPSISIDGEYLGYVAFGGKIRVPKAIITDVVDPYVVGTVTVEMPEGADGKRKVVKTVDGIYLKDASIDRDYFVTANQYGTYLITFSAKDFAGNELSYSYYVNVVDEMAPVIETTLSKTEYKVGETIVAPKATVTDNVDKELSLTIYVQTASGTLYRLKDTEKSFALTETGKCKLMFVAVDSAGNYGITTLDFVVVK